MSKSRDVDLKKKEKEQLTNEEIISLISIYLGEWKHRDEVLWRQVFKYYYATLIVTIFPHITDKLGANIPINDSRIFYYIGIIMSFMFCYISIAVAMRVRASYKAYENSVNLLRNGENTYIRVSLETLKFGKFFKYPLAISIIIIMFISLLTIAIVLLKVSGA